MEKFKKKEAQTKRELKEVKKNLRREVDSLENRLKTEGKLVYNDQKNATMNASEKTSDAVDLSFSLGIIVSKEGTITDAIPGSPAYTAGVGPGMKLIAVNGRKYSKDIVRAALKASVSSRQPIALLVENAEYYTVYQVDYHGGDRYPHLVRNEAQPDMLSEIAKARGR